jgi:hypothetical protein
MRKSGREEPRWWIVEKPQPSTTFCIVLDMFSLSLALGRAIFSGAADFGRN